MVTSDSQTTTGRFTVYFVDHDIDMKPGSLNAAVSDPLYVGRGVVSFLQ
jgi:hypothetical protein